MTAAITHEPIDVAALLAAVAHAGAGCSVVFLGTTRNTNVERRVTRLEYEAYERMAVREMAGLAREAKRRWPLRKVVMVHRVGVVPVRQASVAIAVSAPHRDEGFAAARWLIDRLKEIVPIWKKEHYRGGTVWIGAQQGGAPAPVRQKVPATPPRRVAARRRRSA